MTLKVVMTLQMYSYLRFLKNSCKKCDIKEMKLKAKNKKSYIYLNVNVITCI